MANRRTELERVDSMLQDESLYTDANRKQEMTTLLQQQAELKSELESLEWAWLEASETLENADRDL